MREVVLALRTPAVAAAFHTCVPLNFSVGQVKALVYLEHWIHPVVVSQKLVYKGVTLSDSENLLDVLRGEDISVPVAMHLLVEPQLIAMPPNVLMFPTAGFPSIPQTPLRHPPRPAPLPENQVQPAPGDDFDEELIDQPAQPRGCLGKLAHILKYAMKLVLFLFIVSPHFSFFQTLCLFVFLVFLYVGHTVVGLFSRRAIEERERANREARERAEAAAAAGVAVAGDAPAGDNVPVVNAPVPEEPRAWLPVRAFREIVRFLMPFLLSLFPAYQPPPEQFIDVQN